MIAVPCLAKRGAAGGLPIKVLEVRDSLSIDCSKCVHKVSASRHQRLGPAGRTWRTQTSGRRSHAHVEHMAWGCSAARACNRGAHSVLEVWGSASAGLPRGWALSL